MEGTAAITNPTRATYNLILNQAKDDNRYNELEVQTLLHYYNELDGIDGTALKAEAQRMLDSDVRLTAPARRYLKEIANLDGEDLVLEDFDNVFEDLPPDPTLDDIAAASEKLFDRAEEVYGTELSGLTTVEKVIFLLIKLMEKFDEKIETYAAQMEAGEASGIDPEVAGFNASRFVDKRQQIADILAKVDQAEDQAIQSVWQ